MEAYFTIYGHRELCLILAKRGPGTYDVQRNSDGRCFRVSGVAEFPRGT
ncbi:hypothetical protein M3795_25490 [Ralstonia pickettii]|nr:hypothetical protein [Ralstonia pickettii]MCM3583829.1 hypothetical protein [Ralstonia pickettii]